MRWQSLFDDLEGRLEHELGAEERDVRAEDERLRRGRVELRDRVRALAAGGGEVRFEVDGAPVVVAVAAVGRDWAAGERRGAGPAGSVIVPLAAVSAIEFGAEASDGRDPDPEPATALAARLGLGFALRDLTRRRVPVAVHTAAGIRTGTFDHVGRDHVDLAEHPAGEPRRAVRTVRVLPFDAIRLVRF